MVVIMQIENVAQPAEVLATAFANGTFVEVILSLSGIAVAKLPGPIDAQPAPLVSGQSQICMPRRIGVEDGVRIVVVRRVERCRVARQA